MSTRRPRVLIDGLAFTEGPRWHEERLWFSDIHSRRVMAVDLEGRTETICEVPGLPSGLGWLPDGRLLVVSATERRLLRLEPTGLVLHADLGDLASFHCNDMVVDGGGRAYVGNFGFDLWAGAALQPAEIILVEPEGGARIVASELAFPNGTVITPDGATLIVGESFGARLTAFDVLADGTLAKRRLWARLEGAVPDGICLDAEMTIWLASPVSGEVLRVREGGEVVERIPVERQAFACMLGGRERRTLFICTAGSSDPEECRTNRDSRIEVVDVDVPGVGWP